MQPLKNGCGQLCNDNCELRICFIYADSQSAIRNSRFRKKAVIMHNHLRLIIIVICCGIAGCSPKNDDREHTPENMPAVTMKGFHLIETVNGKPQWELSGKNAETKQEIINIHGITCTFFHPQTEEAVLKVKANDGRLETNTRGIELVGKVVAEDTTNIGAASARGATSKNIFYSSRLIWDARHSVLTSPEEITIQMDGAIFKADTMTINPVTQVVEARGVRISVREDKK